MSEPRIYVFRLSGESGKGGAEVYLLNAPEASTPDDLRVIIAYCATLILRYGKDVDPAIVEHLEHMLAAIGLAEQPDDLEPFLTQTRRN